MGDKNINMAAHETDGVSLAPFDPKASNFVPKPDKMGMNGSARQKPTLTLKNTTEAPKDGNPSSKLPHSAVALYSSNIWSPGHINPANSASIPQKPSWDSFANTPTSASHEPPTPCGNGFSPLPGLGINTSFLRSNDGRIFGANTRSHEDIGSSNRTDQHLSFSENGSFTLHDDKSSGAITASNVQAVSGHNSQQPESFESNDTGKFQTHSSAHANTGADDHKSDSSGSLVLSDHYTLQNPGMADAKPEVWVERSHPRSLRRGLKDPKAEWEEAFDGALTVLAAVNPEHFQMAMGTRVVNIKSEFPGNVITSIRLAKLSVMAQVAERIMKIWDLRQDPSEKVLLLFSVNGSKKFCGLAEMGGPWDPDTSVDGWEENPNAKGKCVGAIPVTWIYIKDVSYLHFSHIRQHHNDHPVGNMWNGMNFEHHVGRAVVEQFVRTPSTSSILGHPKNYYENWELSDVGSSFAQRRGTLSHRGSRGGRGGSFRGGSSFNVPFHRRPVTASETSGDDDATPTAFKNSGRLASDGAAPPKYNVPILGNTKLAPGQVASVTVDHAGNLVLLPSPTGDIFNQNGGPLTSRSFNSPRDFFEAAGHGGGLQHSISMNSMRTTGGPVLHPAVSLESLNQQRGNKNMVSGLASPASYSKSFPSAHGQQPLPASTSMPSFIGTAGRGSARALRNTPGSAFGHSRGVPDTPTHRPHSHFSGGAFLPKLATKEEPVASDEPLSVDQLRAKLSMLQAEMIATQRDLQNPEASSMNFRFLNAKMNRLTLETQEIEAYLCRLSPERLDSSSEQDSVSSGRPNISPLRAADGRPLYSASMVGSPLSTTYGDFSSEANGFRPKHKPSVSWDLREKAVRDLVDSPKQENTTPAPGHVLLQNSNFFATSNGLGNGNSNNWSFGGKAPGYRKN